MRVRMTTRWKDPVSQAAESESCWIQRFRRGTSGAKALFYELQLDAGLKARTTRAVTCHELSREARCFHPIIAFVLCILLINSNTQAQTPAAAAPEQMPNAPM